jgi:hypothetical protein
MINNANRSGSVRARPTKDLRDKPQDESRAGSSTEARADDPKPKPLVLPRKRIVEVNGKRRLVDA